MLCHSHNQTVANVPADRALIKVYERMEPEARHEFGMNGDQRTIEFTRIQVSDMQLVVLDRYRRSPDQLNTFFRPRGHLNLITGDRSVWMK